MADAPGYHQEMTLSYRFGASDGTGARQRDVIAIFNHIKPDRMEGALMVVGLNEGWEFTSVGDAIYTPVEDGYHVPMTMPMALNPTDILVCSIVLCEALENIRLARVVHQRLDDTGIAVYEIVAVHNRLGYPHAQPDPEILPEATYIVGVEDGSIREVRFDDVEVEAWHFYESSDAIAGLGLSSLVGISVNIHAKVTDLASGTHIHDPDVKPESESPPEIAGVDFYAGSFTSEPNPADCTPAKCGAIEVIFSKPVLVLGEVNIWVTSKQDRLGCARGCSSTEPSNTLLFYGSVWEEGTSIWIEPGDGPASVIFQDGGAVITDEYLMQLDDYYFDSPITARPEDFKVNHQQLNRLISERAGLLAGSIVYIM